MSSNIIDPKLADLMFGKLTGINSNPRTYNPPPRQRNVPIVQKPIVPIEYKVQAQPRVYAGPKQRKVVQFQNSEEENQINLSLFTSNKKSDTNQACKEEIVKMFMRQNVDPTKWEASEADDSVTLMKKFYGIYTSICNDSFVATTTHEFVNKYRSFILNAHGDEQDGPTLKDIHELMPITLAMTTLFKEMQINRIPDKVSIEFQAFSVILYIMRIIITAKCLVKLENINKFSTIEELIEADLDVLQDNNFVDEPLFTTFPSRAQLLDGYSINGFLNLMKMLNKDYCKNVEIEISNAFNSAQHIKHAPVKHFDEKLCNHCYLSDMRHGSNVPSFVKPEFSECDENPDETDIEYYFNRITNPENQRGSVVTCVQCNALIANEGICPSLLYKVAAKKLFDEGKVAKYQINKNGKVTGFNNEDLIITIIHRPNSTSNCLLFVRGGKHDTCRSRAIGLIRRLLVLANCEYISELPDEAVVLHKFLIVNKIFDYGEHNFVLHFDETKMGISYLYSMIDDNSNAVTKRQMKVCVSGQNEAINTAKIDEIFQKGFERVLIVCQKDEAMLMFTVQKAENLGLGTLKHNIHVCQELSRKHF